MASRERGKGGTAAIRRRQGTDVRSVQGSDRTNRKRPAAVEDLFGGGETGNLLHPDFDNAKVYAWFQRRHAKGRKLISDDGYYRRGRHEWKVPYGVRYALKCPLAYNQIVVKYPFYATWVSSTTGKRHKKFFSAMVSAIDFVATKAQYVDPTACVVSRTVGYEIPPKLRGKFPRKMRGKNVYWCPFCMDARRYRRVDESQFYALKKVWSDEKQRFVWVERRLAVLHCVCCGLTNKDPKFRRSNQPFELRRIKKGVRRVKARRKVK